MTLTKRTLLLFSCTLMFACTEGRVEASKDALTNPITGTWKLLKTTTIENGDTTVTDYNQNVSFIKIINKSHFAFLQHDLNKGKDSTALFVSGGGRYTLTGNIYKEHLEYCSAREWEGHDFTFNIQLKNDTLIQSGVEKVASAGVDRVTVEKYIRADH